MTEQSPASGTAVNEKTDDRPAIAAAVIVAGGRVLLGRRAVREGTLSWQFPAGAVEDGETPEEAAVRETAEEVGVVVEASRRLGERVHPATGRTMIYVACELADDGEAHVADDELAEVAWCDLARLPELVPHGFFEPVQAHLDAVLA